MSQEPEDNEQEVLATASKGGDVKLRAPSPDALYYKHRLRLSSTPVPCLLIPGVLEDPFFPFWEVAHQNAKDLANGTYRYVVCNCEDVTLAYPCVPCHHRQTWARNMRLKPTQRYAISVLVLKHFHYDGETYLCSGEKCSRCAKGLQRHYGIKRFLVIPAWALEAVKAQIADYPNIGMDASSAVIYDLYREQRNIVLRRNDVTLDERRHLMADLRPHHFDPLNFGEFLLFQSVESQARNLGLENPYKDPKELMRNDVVRERIARVFSRVIREYTDD